MSVFESIPSSPPVLLAELPLLDEAQLAAAAFLARYSDRTLESYRADLRQFFQWAADSGLAPLTATRAHVELYRGSMEQRGLASATIDGGCPRSAATTASPTSMAASRPTRPSTYDAHAPIR